MSGATIVVSMQSKLVCDKVKYVFIDRANCIAYNKCWLGQVIDTIDYGENNAYIEHAFDCQAACQNKWPCAFFMFEPGTKKCHLQKDFNGQTSCPAGLDAHSYWRLCNPRPSDHPEGPCYSETLEYVHPDGALDVVTHVDAAEICQWHCIQEPLCGAWTYHTADNGISNKECFLLPAYNLTENAHGPGAGFISGPKIC